MLHSAGVEVHISDAGPLCEQHSFHLSILPCQVEIVEASLKWPVLHSIPGAGFICDGVSAQGMISKIELANTLALNNSKFYDMNWCKNLDLSRHTESCGQSNTTSAQ